MMYRYAAIALALAGVAGAETSASEWLAAIRAASPAIRDDVYAQLTQEADEVHGREAGEARTTALLQAHIHSAHARLRNGSSALACNASPGARPVEVPSLEFGFEVVLQVPRVHELCKAGKVSKLIICRGSHPLYFFVHRALVRERACTRGQGQSGKDMADFHSQTALAARGQMPDFKRFYAPVGRVQFVYMWNKYNGEWAGAPVNYWPIESLVPLLNATCCRYRVYFRMDNNDSLGTATLGASPGRDRTGRVQRLAAFPDRQTVAASRSARQLDMFVDVRDVEMANVAQLVMLTGARLAIGVQGGIATLGSAVGARMLLLCKAGSECYDTNKTQDFKWHPLLPWRPSIATVREWTDAERLLRWHCQRSTFVHATGSSAQRATGPPAEPAVRVGARQRAASPRTSTRWHW